MGFGFPASARLKTKQDFDLVKEKGSRFTGRLCILNLWNSPEVLDRKVGIIVSRKVGCSTTRSRAKRLLRESYRLNQHRLYGSYHMVLIGRYHLTSQSCAAVEKEFLKLCEQAGILLES
ncbi:MAG: ribonuclease P protein component [Verrucomicrobiota bacterium]|nr:ribonuclease P protein component [Verrucomicrobiota bacterium]